MIKQKTVKLICLMFLYVFFFESFGSIYCFASEINNELYEGVYSEYSKQSEDASVIIDANEDSTIVPELPEELEELNQGAPVIIDGAELFTIKTRVNSFYQEDRAKLVRDKVVQVAKDHSILVDDVHLNIRDEETLIEIVVGEISISTVTAADAAAVGLSVLTVATDRKEKIKEAIQNYRDARQIQRMSVQFIKTLCLTALLVLLFYVFRKGIKLCKDPVAEKKLLGRYLVKIPGVKLLPLKHILRIISYLGIGLISILRILSLFFYFLFVLDFFPWTAAYSKQLLKYVNSFSDTVGQSILDYLPNLLIIIVVLFVTNILNKFIRFIFRQLKTGSIKIDKFYPEWADTSAKLARFFLIAIALIIIYPYIPGSSSVAFQGISVFLGLIISFGSGSVVANIVSGFVMTYNRAFQVGDWVQIGENMGEIIEKSMLSTRMRTAKKADITIPNSIVISTSVTNYSSSSKDKEMAFILHTTVSIGYDVHWQTANKLLLKAISDIPDILKNPKPFVLQKQLNDFSISYEVNAYTNKPNLAAKIYSDMYKNIMDTLQESGIELMTMPHFTMHNDDESDENGNGKEHDISNENDDKNSEN